MNKAVTVTIGIPAYNEGANIGYLLDELHKQKTGMYTLEKILVVSDGSTDKTVDAAKAHSADVLTVIDSPKRLGLAKRQNEILSQTDSDVLILLNADISIKDAEFIEKIIQPIIQEKADLVTPEFRQMKPKNNFERVLYVSNKLKKEIYETLRNGKNVYTCCGPARAFSKKLYKKLQFKDSSSEDAYSYLYAVSKAYTYHHTKKTSIYYRLPDNFSDHIKQSTRFFRSRKQLTREFGQKKVSSSYRIPKAIATRLMLHYFALYPVEIIWYGCMLAYAWLASLRRTKSEQIWSTSISSKIVR